MKQFPDADYAFRFIYSDDSAFQIYADGRAYILAPDGSIRDEPRGSIVNRIPLLIEQARSDAYANADCEPK